VLVEETTSTREVRARHRERSREGLFLPALRPRDQLQVQGFGVNARIIPPGLTFEQALRLGYTGPIRVPGYLAWIRTLPCDVTGKPGPSDPSHPNFFKSSKNKAPDPFAIPECREAHEEYERNGFPDEQRRLARAALYMLQAIYEGRLKWIGS
jgi:hypothetical protein